MLLKKMSHSQTHWNGAMVLSLLIVAGLNQPGTLLWDMFGKCCVRVLFWWFTIILKTLKSPLLGKELILGACLWPSVWVCALCFSGPEFASLDPGCGPTYRSSSHAVAASHIEELEWPITRICNCALGLWGGKRKEEDWQQMLAQGQFSSPPPPPKKEKKECKC